MKKRQKHLARGARVGLSILGSTGLLAGAAMMIVLQSFAADDRPTDENSVTTSYTPLVEVVQDEQVFNPPEIISGPIDPTFLNDINTSAQLFDDRDPTEFHHLIPPARNLGTEWKIYKTEWDAADEQGYAALITSLGRSKCASLDECLRDPANPYRDLESDEIYYGDCADMAYFLRAYYAWKNGLPFSYQHQMNTVDNSREDLRYSTRGNVVTGRRDVTSTGKPIYAPTFLRRIGGEVSTAMFRTHPVTGTRGTFDDFYPVEMSREFLKPGAIAYDVFGHVGLVFEIEDDGRVLIFASHPDLSVTRSLYGANFMRTGPDFGGGLKGWRPIKLVGARKMKDGSYRGGRIVGADNADSPGFSMVQYEGNVPHPSGDWQLGEFYINDRTLTYYDYVRASLAGPGYKPNPITEVRNALRNICSELQARRVAVRQAVQSKIHLKDHPEKLPPNIFGTYGTWEAFSTPSRDARLKTSFVETLAMVQQYIGENQTTPQLLDYQGTDLAGALLHALQEEQRACRIAYKRSDDSHVVLNMTHIMERLFDLSFDPYHCPERRWGASGYELQSCTDDDEKAQWYHAQRYLRYQTNRTYDTFTGFKLSQLRSPDEASPQQGGIGQSTPPDIDVRRYLWDHRATHTTVGVTGNVRILKHSGWTNNQSE